MEDLGDANSIVTGIAAAEPEAGSNASLPTTKKLIEHAKSRSFAVCNMNSSPNETPLHDFSHYTANITALK